MAKDLAVTLSGRILVDANAAKGIASRRGVGRARHLHVATLWLQEAVAQKRLLIVKQKGTENVADLGTKHLPASTLEKLMKLASLQVLTGRSDKALRSMTA